MPLYFDTDRCCKATDASQCTDLPCPFGRHPHITVAPGCTCATTAPTIPVYRDPHDHMDDCALVTGRPSGARLADDGHVSWAAMIDDAPLFESDERQKP